MDTDGSEPMGITIVWPDAEKTDGARKESEISAGTSSENVAEPELSEIEKELGRPVRVAMPQPESAEVVPEEVPPASGESAEESDNFYQFTPADYARMEAVKRRNKERTESAHTMKTSKMRELEKQQRARQIGFAIVRVRFSDRVELEMEFKPLEPVSTLYEILQRCTHLRPVPAFYLFTAPPKQRLRGEDDPTFLHAGLAPAALVHLAFEGVGAVDTNGQSFLRPELLALGGVGRETMYAAAERKKQKEQTHEKGGGDSSSVAAPAAGASAPKKKLGAGGKPKWFKL